MLRNRFRKGMGLIILVLFFVAIGRYFAQTAGNPYLWSALSAGLVFTLFLAVVVGAVYLIDRRIKKREH
jgi:threonine/homoserine/homoserine lactone efflux protein